jgi:hypothetical protein
MKELLECDEAWESFLPELDARSQAEMAYSGGEDLEELSEDFLNEAITDSEAEEVSIGEEDE